MRVSIFNCVSTALDMLRLSTDSIYYNAGTDDFDYLVVTWLMSKEVKEYLDSMPEIIQIPYATRKDIGYVPNLRNMMNLGFTEGFKRNDYCGLVNTDMFFGKDWLKNLMKHASENIIVNSTHITPIKGRHVITADLGIPTYETFDFDKFKTIYYCICKDEIITEEDRDGQWVNVATMPYLYHRKWWERCGPWELQVIEKHQYPTPDRRFWQRCSQAGAKFIMVRDSIVYHHEAVERKRKRPPGAEVLVSER